MSDPIRMAFEREWAAARAASRTGALDTAFHHLERAHIVGQRRTLLHVRSHLGMLALGWARRDRREVIGQVGRIVAAALLSRVWVPTGNTGGANVPALASLPLPPDLADLLGKR